MGLIYKRLVVVFSIGATLLILLQAFLAGYYIKENHIGDAIKAAIIGAMWLALLLVALIGYFKFLKDRFSDEIEKLEASFRKLQASSVSLDELANDKPTRTPDCDEPGHEDWLNQVLMDEVRMVLAGEQRELTPEEMRSIEVGFNNMTNHYVRLRSIVRPGNSIPGVSAEISPEPFEESLEESSEPKKPVLVPVKDESPKPKRKRKASPLKKATLTADERRERNNAARRAKRAAEKKATIKAKRAALKKG